MVIYKFFIWSNQEIVVITVGAWIVIYDIVEVSLSVTSFPHCNLSKVYKNISMY